jgi:hypothetical protein
MKTQIEHKLNKLPDSITTEDCVYYFNMHKHDGYWFIAYCDLEDNPLFIVEHTSLQAAVDNTLSTIKTLNGNGRN